MILSTSQFPSPKKCRSEVNWRVHWNALCKCCYTVFSLGSWNSLYPMPAYLHVQYLEFKGILAVGNIKG